MYEDCYFLNYTEAFRVAKQQNKLPNNEDLQVCYYDGEKVDSEYVNLIHLSIDRMSEELVDGIYRIPTSINFIGMNLSASLEYQIRIHFMTTMQQVEILRAQINQKYYKNLKNASLNFNEPLRFYLSANSTTEVMQYVSQNIVKSLELQGYEVRFNLYHQIEDYSSLKVLSEFNPHVTININHINNEYISENVFNFVWFQDPMPIFFSDAKIELRERDFIYSLVPELDTLLEKKSIPYKRQSFCTNEDIYKINPKIKREKKIVFIGSSYYNGSYDNQNNRELISHVIKLFKEGTSFTKVLIEEIAQKFDINKNYLEIRIIPYVVRDISLQWLCSIQSEYTIEVYGNGWEHYEDVVPFYKGVLKYGDEIAEVYNSAMYAFAPHQTYILQQRVFEASGCGAIPIVYDCRDNLSEESYDEAFYYFKTKKDLEILLQTETKTEKYFERLLEENSYEHFIQNIVDIVKKVNK